MEKDVLMSVLTKTLNKTEDEVSDLIYEKADDSDELTIREGAADLILDADAKRIQSVKKSKVTPEQITKAFENGYSKGKQETMEKFERDLKETYELESDAEGLDLVKDIVTTVAKCELDDNVKNHPEYLALEKSRVPKDKYKQLQEEFENYKANQERIERFGKIRQDAMSVLTSLKPVESSNPKVAQTHREDFLRKFENYDFEIDEKGNHLILKKGERIEDEHGNAVNFKDFVHRVASDHYDFVQSDSKGQAGNVPSSNGSPISVPKTKEEFLAKYQELRAQGKIQESVKLVNAYNASQKI